MRRGGFRRREFHLLGRVLGAFGRRPRRPPVAMYETIVANRGKFPPGEFYIHTELPDGASITTFIPAAGAPADSGPAWNDPGSAGMDMQARAHIVAAMLAAGSPLAGRG